MRIDKNLFHIDTFLESSSLTADRDTDISYEQL